ncbi:trypsin-like peptidase domain-containing protein [Pedobacter paludis]|uniref:Serine protease n=1 Tax=Pedobacter paludis TaxID=2203212 RepID=A0A317EZ34_9SPHI|nr:trypsin-like peptidase domain-containing protein [Pedobacter paludis]PWS32104.1 serine protease [Pedobacter paludis]
MKKILGITVLAAFIGGAAAIGGYKLFERNQLGGTISEKQQLYFANNPLKVSSAGEADFTQAAAAVAPGVVHIKTTYAASSKAQGGSSPFDMFDDFFGGGGRQMQRQPRAASGSGVIISQDGYIVTNNHVVENADKVEVILTDRRKVEAKVIGRDPNTDLALIKVNATGLPVVKMGNSDNVQVGEWVLAVGYPLDLNTTVTAGIVSAKARSIGIIGREQQQGNQLTEEEYEEYRRTGKRPQQAPNSSIEAFIQTDAAINPGNSGGALVNANGELIGINSAIASQSGYNQGYGFAIPVNLARKIVDDFMKYGSVKRGYIGVNFVPLSADNPEEIKTSEINGLYVNDVVAGGGAEAAGLKSGDIIKKVDGATIYDSPDLQEKVGRLNPGDKVRLTVLRDGALKDYTVTLKGEASVGVVAKNNAAKGAEISKLGATFAPVSPAQKSKFGIANGVVVTGVAAGKAFDSYGIPKGLIITKVNGLNVNSVADVQKALPQTKNNIIRIAGVDEQGTYNFNFPIQ